MIRGVPKRTRSQRRRAGAAGGRAYNGVGKPSAGPQGAPIGPDELVFGTAAQLREMAETMRRGGQAATRAAVNSRGRIDAFRRTHPETDPSTLVGRPLCATDAPPRPRVTRERAVRVATNATSAEIWIDDYLFAPNPWGDGISSRDVREALDEVGAQDVIVHMNSGGGDYFEGVAIYQALTQHPGGVYVAIDALAASAASVIAMAGDTVGIGDGAFVMIHEASGFAYGTSEDMLAMADMLDTIGDEIAGFYARKTGASVEEMRKAMRAETWYGPQAAIDAKLADESLNPPAADDDPVDAGDDEDELDPEVAALFSWARPQAAAPPPPAPTPEPEPAPCFADLFDDDLMELQL